MKFFSHFYSISTCYLFCYIYNHALIFFLAFSNKQLYLHNLCFFNPVNSTLDTQAVDMFAHSVRSEDFRIDIIFRNSRKSLDFKPFSLPIYFPLTSILRTQRALSPETNPPAALSAPHTPFPATPHNLLQPLPDDRKS